MRITGDHIFDLWRVEPTLGYSGFVAALADLRWEQRQLLKASDEIQLCYDWLQLQSIGRKLSYRDPSSYYLKHALENQLRRTQPSAYIPNGAMLAPALLLGVPYQRYCSSPNAALAVRGDKRNRVLHGEHALWASGYADFYPLQKGQQCK